MVERVGEGESGRERGRESRREIVVERESGRGRDRVREGEKERFRVWEREW